MQHKYGGDCCRSTHSRASLCWIAFPEYFFATCRAPHPTTGTQNNNRIDVRLGRCIRVD